MPNAGHKSRDSPLRTSADAAPDLDHGKPEPSGDVALLKGRMLEEVIQKLEVDIRWSRCCSRRLTARRTRLEHQQRQLEHVLRLKEEREYYFNKLLSVEVRAHAWSLGGTVSTFPARMCPTSLPPGSHLGGHYPTNKVRLSAGCWSVMAVVQSCFPSTVFTCQGP